MEEVILSYKGITLRRSDLDILEGDCYLNDQIIGFYFSYLSSLCQSEDLLLVPPTISFWLANSGDRESINEFVGPLALPEKNLVIFAVNDSDELGGGGESGTHWSLLVYHRRQNAFVHHDSMQGVNSSHAEKLFEVLKGYVGPAAGSSLEGAKSRGGKKKGEKKRGVLEGENKSTPPCFKELPTPQQANGYDCGLYVMAIARVVCEWHTGNSKSKGDNWFSALEKQVGASVEFQMRNQVLQLIHTLKEEEI